jgi:hypothetical protein
MTTTIYVNKNNEITIICSQCGKLKKHMLNNVSITGKRLKIKCGCGHVFSALIEGRRHYRKRVTLSGTCRGVDALTPAEGMVVENISSCGITFRTQWRNQFKIGDILRVSFVLDNLRRTEISKTVMVRNVREHFVGVEFCQPDEPNAILGFYLMPN